MRRATLYGVSPHQPDRRALRQAELVADPEAMAGVERDVALCAGLEVSRYLVAVAVLEHLPQQRAAEPLSLASGLRAQDRQVPVRRLRVTRLDLDQAAHHLHGAATDARREDGELLERLERRVAPLVRPRPHGHGGAVLGEVDLALADQHPRTALEEAPRVLGAAALVLEDPVDDRVVVERTCEHLPHRRDVLPARLADVHGSRRTISAAASSGLLPVVSMRCTFGSLRIQVSCRFA